MSVKTYSRYLASLAPEDRRKYVERPTPVDRRTWRGATIWDAEIGRHVAVR